MNPDVNMISTQQVNSLPVPQSDLVPIHNSFPEQSSVGRLGITQSRVHSVRNTTQSQNYYYRKWRRLKKIIKNTVFLNAAACDEVVRVEEKLAKAKEERRFLLRKLLQYQSAMEGNVNSPVIKTEPTLSKLNKSPSNSSLNLSENSSDIVKIKAKKKIPSTAGEKKKLPTTTIATTSSVSKEVIDSIQTKPKKSKSQNQKRTIPPIPLDYLGRPVFPMVMGDLTVHSIGEIMDKHSFYCADSIYPVGYVSTRLYANMYNVDSKCLYTCKISDHGGRPVFDIAPDDSPEQIIRAHSPDACIGQLIKVINKAKGTELAAMPGNGVDFFGLSHPLIRNLIQSCPGAKKCSGYKWVKFEVNKNESLDGIEHCSNDPVVHFEALKKVLSQIGALKNPLLEQSSNLRSLLTSGPFAKPSNSS